MGREIAILMLRRLARSLLEKLALMRGHVLVKKARSFLSYSARRAKNALLEADRYLVLLEKLHLPYPTLHHHHHRHHLPNFRPTKPSRSRSSSSSSSSNSFSTRSRRTSSSSSSSSRSSTSSVSSAKQEEEEEEKEEKKEKKEGGGGGEERETQQSYDNLSEEEFKNAVDEFIRRFNEHIIQEQIRAGDLLTRQVSGGTFVLVRSA